MDFGRLWKVTFRGLQKPYNTEGVRVRIVTMEMADSEGAQKGQSLERGMEV